MDDQRMDDQRDYLAEAQRIIDGTTLLVPQREHLEALVALAQRLGRKLTEIDEALTTLSQIAKKVPHDTD